MKKYWITYGSIWAVLAAVHLIILIAPGSHWDGALFAYLAAKGDMATLHTWLSTSSLHPHEYIYKALALSGTYLPFTARLSSLVALGVSACLVYRLLTECMFLPRPHALFICMIMVSWPFLHMMMIETMVAQMVLMACFYGGWLLYLNNRLHCILRAIGCGLIVLSFYHGLYLLLHLALFITLCSANPTEWKIFLRKHGWIVVLPFAFYFVKNTFMPVTGAFSQIDYNVPLILRKNTEFLDGASRITWLTVDGMRRGIFQPFFLVGAMFKNWPLTIAGVLAISIWLTRRQPMMAWPLLNRQKKNWLFICGLLMMGAIVLTHAAVDQYIQIFRPSARHATHAAVAFGFMALALILVLPARIQKIKPMLAVLLVTAFTMSTFYGHMMWISKQAKDAAVTHLLTAQPRYKDIYIYLFDDFDAFEGWGWKNDYFERTLMTQAALNSEGIFGYSTSVLKADKPEAMIADMAKALNMHNIKVDIPAGRPKRLCAAVVNITSASNMGAGMAAFQYLYYRWIEKNALNAWLEGLVKVELTFINMRGDNRACAAPK